MRELHLMFPLDLVLMKIVVKVVLMMKKLVVKGAVVEGGLTLVEKVEEVIRVLATASCIPDKL